MNTPDEIRQYYGPKFCPHKNTNLRHRVFLRKSVELLTERLVEERLEQYNQLSATMGTGGNAHHLGTVLASREINGERRNREGPTPSREVRTQLGTYLDAYDRCFKKRGNEFRVLNRADLAILQNAEQVWHDWIVGYLGRPRPQWALEPLPGLARVRVAPAAPRGVKRQRAQKTESKVPPKKMKFLGTIDLTLD
ncbi:hypothetical protein C8R45DRAFT_1101478 [Mycena sanguinolenta]|nr:hypothetical protein C8R45DRAFT_1101478 [Mycena sanguinolenta]